MKVSSTRRIGVMEPLEGRTLLAGSTTSTPVAVDPQHVTDWGDRVVFLGKTGTAGQEVWISDGTAAGTRMLRDIKPARGGSAARLMGSTGKLFYFFADTGNAKTTGLWRTDGKGRGTVFVRRFDLAEADQLNFDASVGGRMMFTRHIPATGTVPAEDQLWISDGTADGTTKLAGGFTVKDGLRNWHVRRGVGYFIETVRDLSTKIGYRSQLWRSDGTVAGTRPLGFNLDLIVNTTMR